MTRSIFTALDTIFQKLSILAILLLGLVIMIEVIFRYIPWFSFAQPWVPGTLDLLDTWLIFLGSVVGMHQNKHLRITFFVDKIPQRMREWNNIVVNLITLCLLVFIIYYSIPIVRSGMDLGFGGVPFTKGYAFIALPICSFPMTLIVGRRIVESVKKLRLEDTP